MSAYFDTTALVAALEAERTRRVKDYREQGSEPDYSWGRIARETGVNNASLYKIKGGGKNPDVHTLARLLTWLGSYDVRPFITHDQASLVVRDARRPA